MFAAQPRTIGRRQPWSVLGPLLVVQWLALAVFAAAATHNGWLYYQGGDQSYYWTDAHLLSRWTLPVALVGYAWSYLLIPIAFFAGSNVLSGLPVVIVLNALILLPVALLCVYGIATRIAGRVFGYWAAALWIVIPYATIPMFDQRYHEKYVDITLPQSLGLTVLARLPLHRLPARHRLAARPRPRHPRLDGRRPGGADRRLHDRAQAVERALLRRRRALPAGRDPVGADGSLPGRARTGSLPARPLETARAGRAPRVRVDGRQRREHGRDRRRRAASAPCSPRSTATSTLDWHHLHQNIDGVREFFWAVRPLEFVPLAGLLAIGRRSWPKAVLVFGWFITFLLIKGTDSKANIEDASFFRLLMPSFPAFLLLLAAIPLLVPAFSWSRRVLPDPVPALPTRRAGRRVLAVAAVVLVVLPLIFVAGTTPQSTAEAVSYPFQDVYVPVRDFGLKVANVGGRQVLTWKRPYSGKTAVFYTILRSRPVAPDPSSNGDRKAIDGLACRDRQHGAPLNCLLYMDHLSSVPQERYIDRAPPGRWTYRVGMTANWKNDLSLGDIMIVSKPVTVNVPG